MKFEQGILKPKGVYWNLNSQSSSQDRCAKGCKCCVYFPSQGEYKLFLQLSSALKKLNGSVLLYVHRPLTYIIRWNIDFCLIAQDEIGRKYLASLCNSLEGSQYISVKTLWIEYKGILDRNFLFKFSTIAKNSAELNSRLIIIKEKEDLIVYKYRGEVKRKKIHTPNQLHKTLTVCFNGLKANIRN